MTTLPEPPAASAAGQVAPTDADRERIRRLMAAVDEINTPTSFRDPAPIPAVGPTPPVTQPGVPPMSQQATDIGRAAMYCGLATVPPGLVATLILVASEHADPTVIAWICAAPAAIAVPILALSRLLKAAGQAVPPEHHHHYSGPVQQHSQTVTNGNRWLGRSTTNL